MSEKMLKTFDIQGFKVQVYEKTVYISAMNKTHDTKKEAEDFNSFLGVNDVVEEKIVNYFELENGQKFYGKEQLLQTLKIMEADKIIIQTLSQDVTKMSEEEIAIYNKIKNLYPDYKIYTITEDIYKQWILKISKNKDVSTPIRIIIGKIHGTIPKIEINNYDIGNHYFESGVCSFLLKKIEDMNNFPIISLTFVETTIEFFPKDTGNNITKEEYETLLKESIADYLKNQTRSGYTDIINNWKNLEQSFLRSSNNCLDIPENYKFECKRHTPPLISSSKPLLFTENLEDSWIEDNYECLIKENSRFKLETVKNVPGVLNYEKGEFGDIKTIKTECNDSRYAKCGLSCLVLHSKRIPIITDEHMINRKNFNLKNGESFQSILKKWEKVYDECLEEMIQIELNKLAANKYDLNIPSFESLKNVSYKIYYDHLHETDSRLYYLLNQINWREYRIASGSISFKASNSELI